jgi:predicted flavoprotein YhiN
MRPERLTAPAADAASVLEHELRRLFQRDEISEIDKRRLEKLARAVTKAINKDCATIGLVSAALGAGGVDTPNFKRKLREYHQDFEPEPTGPAAMKEAA